MINQIFRDIGRPSRKGKQKFKKQRMPNMERELFNMFADIDKDIGMNMKMGKEKAKSKNKKQDDSWETDS